MVEKKKESYGASLHNKFSADGEEFYKQTLARLQSIQKHLETAPRSGRLRGKVCVVTGVGSLKGIGCVMLSVS
jgi:hypothetical protein